MYPIDSTAPEETVVDATEDCTTWSSEALLAEILLSRTSASALLARFRSIHALSESRLSDLIEVRSMGLARAQRLLAAIELGRRVGFPPVHDRVVRSPVDIVRLVAPSLWGLKREAFLILLLNTRHRLLKVETISIGSLATSVVHPREVFRPAVLAAAGAIAVAHNHPSGDPEPSEDDLEITTRLRDAGRLLGIEVVDHVIVGAPNRFISLRERGLL